MPFLTRHDILTAVDLPQEAVAVPEWGGEVLVRGLDGAGRDAFELSVKSPGRETDLSNIRAKLVARCVIDEHGNPLFGEGDIEVLGRKSAAALDRVFDAAQRLSGLKPGDVDSLKKG